MAKITGGKVVVSMDDGSTVELQLTAAPPVVTPPVDPPPVTPPTPDPVPANPLSVTCGTSTHTLDGVNKQRDKNQLILYRAPLTTTPTNMWGTEVTVVGGKVAAFVDRQAKSQAAGIAIPSEGFVLSGHDTAADWLRANTTVGSTVTLSDAAVTPDSPPVAPPAPTPGKKIIAGYLMDGQDVDQIPACYTQIRVAFVRMSNGQLRPVEWGGKTPAQTQAQLASWVKQGGHDVLLAVGGSGGGSNLDSVDAFVSGFRSIAVAYSATGLDFDEEGGDLNVANAVASAKSIAAGREKEITFSFVPPGGPPVDVYMRAAVACQQAGLKVIFGFQGYDAVDSDDEILGRTADAVAKLGESSVVIGFMIGDDPAHRTPAECESLMRRVVARWPNIAGAYFWEIARPGTTDAAQRVARVLGA